MVDDDIKCVFGFHLLVPRFGIHEAWNHPNYCLLHLLHPCRRNACKHLNDIVSILLHLLQKKDNLNTSYRKNTWGPKKNLELGFQVFKRRSYGLLLLLFLLSMAKRTNEQQWGRIHSNAAAAKKRHNDKILLPYEDRIQTSLLYRIFEDQRNPRCRFPSVQKLEL